MTYIMAPGFMLIPATSPCCLVNAMCVPAACCCVIMGRVSLECVVRSAMLPAASAAIAHVHVGMTLPVAMGVHAPLLIRHRVQMCLLVVDWHMLPTQALLSSCSMCPACRLHWLAPMQAQMHLLILLLRMIHMLLRLCSCWLSVGLRIPCMACHILVQGLYRL